MKTVESIGISRRNLIAVAGLSAGATLLFPPFADKSGIWTDNTQCGSETQNTSFGSLKQINAGLLSVGYADVGRANGLR